MEYFQETYKVSENITGDIILVRVVWFLDLIGFGTFYVGERSARSGRNPRTGATINIKAAKSPKFRAGKGLKDAVN